MRLTHAKRAGLTAVESALVYPVTFLLILGLLIGAAGIFRYQEVASLARRGARYAIVHGTQYAKENGKPAATPEDIYNTAIAPYAVCLDSAHLSYAVTYNKSNEVFASSIVNGDVVGTRNTVSVTVSYEWIPQLFFPKVTLSSTSVMPMSY